MRIVKQINFHASFLLWFLLSIFYHSHRRKWSCRSLGHCPPHHLRGSVHVCVCTHVCICVCAYMCEMCERQGNKRAVIVEMKVVASWGTGPFGQVIMAWGQQDTEAWQCREGLELSDWGKLFGAERTQVNFWPSQGEDRKGTSPELAKVLCTLP